MAATIREQIIEDIKTQLETLTSSGYGYAYRGRTWFAHSDLPAMALLPGIETAERMYGQQRCTMPVMVHAIQVSGDNEPSVLAEAILGDLIHCLIGGMDNIGNIDDIRYIGGGVEDWPSEDEQALVVQINLEVDYTTNLGDPYNQTEL